MDSQNKPPLDMCQLVTDKIIALFEQGIIPWQKPWKDAGIPMNLLSKRAYKGINLWLLNALGYAKNYFLTWEQIKTLGGSVNKDEKGHMVVFWKMVKRKPEELDDRGVAKTTPMLQYYKVFNIAQCRDIPTTLIPVVDETVEPLNPVLECEAILNTMPDMPQISFKGKAAAYYNVELDEITLPKMKDFKSNHGYYATLFHELIHATGAEKRLNRKTLVDRVPFGTPCYAQEELVAEMGAAFLCQFTGILSTEITNTVAYLDNWLGVLKNDKRFIIQASGAAQKAVEFILNSKAEDTNDEAVETKEESMVG
jgi:antirestriction protein ArdC